MVFVNLFDFIFMSFVILVLSTHQYLLWKEYHSWSRFICQYQCGCLWQVCWYLEIAIELLWVARVRSSAAWPQSSRVWHRHHRSSKFHLYHFGTAEREYLSAPKAHTFYLQDTLQSSLDYLKEATTDWQQIVHDPPRSSTPNYNWSYRNFWSWRFPDGTEWPDQNRQLACHHSMDV